MGATETDFAADRADLVIIRDGQVMPPPGVPAQEARAHEGRTDVRGATRADSGTPAGGTWTGPRHLAPRPQSSRSGTTASRPQHEKPRKAGRKGLRYAGRPASELPLHLLIPTQGGAEQHPTPTRGPSVLLCTEGTYPFAGGGVSTWCDILCRQMPDVDFTLFAVTGSPDVRAEYELPLNARKVVHVPLWGMQEPAEYPLADLACTDFLRRKRTTTERSVTAQFVPHLRMLIRSAGDEGLDVGPAGEALAAMWRYFREYDWNKTWKARATWDAFVQEVLLPYEDGRVEALRSERPTISDLTTSLRWTYNFLMPLVAPLPDVALVHSTIASFAALPGVVAKIERATPFLLTEHGVYARERYIAVSGADFPFYAKRYLLQLTALMSRICYRYADVVAPVANFNKRWELRYGARQDQIQTVYNGIDPQVFVPGPKPVELRDIPVAVAAARVFPLKDIETMIRSAHVARRQLPDVRFLVYGSLDADRPYVERCKALIEDLDLGETFIFGGFHSSPAQVYNCGDISVLSSISEGFPYTVLESMSCARPVAATDVGGVSEALSGYGLVVPPRDGTALGEAAVELLRDGERRSELGRLAREQVLARYRTTHSVDSYRTLYERLVTGTHVTRDHPSAWPSDLTSLRRHHGPAHDSQLHAAPAAALQ